ncbi:MAG: hypothetical protein HYU64_11795 [Armatimonadetes bacterium]|nr:hypothetical protein [Armatimonadota bacterium]
MNLLNGLIAFTRPGQEAGAFLDKMKELDPNYEEKTHLVKVWLDLSGTEIRKRLQDGVSIRYLVPDSVESYILKRRLYRRG